MQIVVTFNNWEEFAKYFVARKDVEKLKAEAQEKPAAAAVPKPAAQPKGPSLKEVRKALADANQKAQKNVAKELIQGLGYQNLMCVPEEKYADLLEAVKSYAG